MAHTASDSTITGRHSLSGWGLPAIGIAALLLVIVALGAFPLIGRNRPDLAPLSTPEGVVQRFFGAVYGGDYVAAYAMLSVDAQREVTLNEFQQRLRYERESEMRIDTVAIHTDTATVTVTITHFGSGGLFGTNEWSNRYDLLLERSNETWLLMSAPFW
ncbi:MAG: hypothetical protein HC822_02670 [Oscillochloris sp.]|nr:hypothetical protein [Oscillochloris sp.]